MNNPKLTNVLLIALVVVNCFLLIGWAAGRHHHRMREKMWMSYRMHNWHRFAGWAFHQRAFYRHMNSCPCEGNGCMRNM